MNNYDDNNNQRIEAPNADDFLGGNYLKKEDLDGAITVTINDVWSETMRGQKQPKLVVGFREFEKGLILNKTNIRILASTFRTTNTANWRGEVELYVEENVEYSGRVVGGIRIRGLVAKREEPRRNGLNGSPRRYDDEVANY